MENSKIGYIFDKMTGEFLGTEIVYLEKRTGNYPHADNITFVEPPEVIEHQKQRWNGTSWDIVADFRGEKYYDVDGLEVGIIIELGDLDDKIIKTPPQIDEFHKLHWKDDDWNIILKEDCVEEDGQFRQMNQAEKIIAGLEEIPDGMKIVNGELTIKDRDDLYAEGKITFEEYNKQVDEERQMRYKMETDKMALMYLRGECTLEEWKSAMDKIREELPKK